VTTIGLYDIGKSTTLESNKSLNQWLGDEYEVPFLTAVFLPKAGSWPNENGTAILASIA
jgi:hypothetical protein